MTKVQVETHKELQYNNKMLLLKESDELKRDEQQEMMSLSTKEEEDSSTNSSEYEEELEIIQLQEDSDDDEYEIMINGYKKMELKGESESDKDLIIYSLNESLQIHKEIVERIQNEKDDLEDKFELEKLEYFESKKDIEFDKEIIENQANKLEIIYQNLLKELELKKLEYRRMETRFYSHIKSIRSTEDDLTTIYQQFIQLFNQIHNTTISIKSKLYNNQNIINHWFNSTTIIQSIQLHLQPLDDDIISLLTEKLLIEIIIQDILNTSIHPGISLNHSFGKIHQWVEKRNFSWASRMKQQISSFIVKQSNEENDQIEQAKEEIIIKILSLLSHVYHDTDKIKRKITSIVNLAFKLNLALKCQENEIQIITFEEGGITLFNDHTMVSIENNTGDNLLLLITPHIVALGDHGFNIPAKVYCV